MGEPEFCTSVDFLFVFCTCNKNALKIRVLPFVVMQMVVFDSSMKNTLKTQYALNCGVIFFIKNIWVQTGNEIFYKSNRTGLCLLDFFWSWRQAHQ